MVNSAFLTHCEMELARKVFMRDEATKTDCEDIIQPINYEMDGQMSACN